ncbi:MAG: manganese ABC transporter ATP-binding protein [Chloroflexi bacterium]|nr:MAG: manganese ABC transporter ATP-binding protein [Chloroflexota bacterium]HDN79121.1 metal ABC transporter ATP-binding protein [Chloroflexota bacterium]
MEMAPFASRGVVHKKGTPILELSGVTVCYNGRVALEDVSFRLEEGEQIAVVGPNGAGKSTLFKVIAGVLRPTKGDVKVYGHEPGGHICIAYVPQRSQVDLTFPVTVADVVMMGRIGKLGPLRWPRARDWEFVHHCLQIVGLADLANRQIGELSGGQQQRVFIARALAQEAELMLMDEPLTGLDLTSQEEILRILDELRNHQVTIMVATHDLSLASERFDRVMLLNRRLLGIGHPQEVFTPEHLKEAYGGHLRLVQSADGIMVLSDTCCGRGIER